MPEAEQRAFIIGVANGRGMTSGLFEAYAGAAEDMAGSPPAEREAVASAYRTIRGMVQLLTIDAVSLLNGVRAACRRARSCGTGWSSRRWRRVQPGRLAALQMCPAPAVGRVAAVTEPSAGAIRGILDDL